MPVLTKNTPILVLQPQHSYFLTLNTEKKTPSLTDVTKIDFSLMENGEVNAEALANALRKLELTSVHLLISDELFLHYIGDFPTKDDIPLEQQITNTIATAFPDQAEPLHIVTLDLAKTSKTHTIQITAMAKKNLTALGQAIGMAGVTVKTVVPLSFVVKAFVSIDPSLFVLETPENLLLTSHYIGVDFAMSLEDHSVGALKKAVAQIKKDHPHIQHIYVLGSEALTAEITESLSAILPVQHVEIQGVTAEEDTPLFLQAAAFGYKEIVENKFPYPHFSVEPIETIAVVGMPKDEEVIEKEVEQEAEKSMPKPTKSVREEAVIRAPETLAAKAELEPEVKEVVEDEPAPSPTKTAAATEPEPNSPFTILQSLKSDPAALKTAPKARVAPISPATRNTRGWLSYIFLALVIALLIALIGGGVIISQGNMTPSEQVSPVPVETIEATPEPTPEPTPTPVPVSKTDLEILVVNATSTSGKAGRVANAIKQAGFKTVDSGNAKGKYDTAGTFVMSATSLPEEIIADLTAAIDVEELEPLELDTVEDTAKKYDVIIVLNE